MWKWMEVGIGLASGGMTSARPAYCSQCASKVRDMANAVMPKPHGCGQESWVLRYAYLLNEYLHLCSS
jgi:hypothetical protein